MLNSKHALGVLAKGFCLQLPLLLLCPESLLSWFLEISGFYPEPARRALLPEISRELASLGSLAQQPHSHLLLFRIY